MIPEDLTFGFPNAAWLIIASIVFIAPFWTLFLYRKKARLLFTSQENLSRLLVPRSPFIYVFKATLFCCIWILAALALMQPKGNGYYPDKMGKSDSSDKLKAHDLIFLVDASASMAVTDGKNGKSRLDSAKEIADEILSDLTGESAALYAFTSNSTKMSPTTPDLFFVRLMLRQLSINESGIPGTDFLKTLQEVKLKQFKQTANKLNTLIILSDGGDTTLEALQGDAHKNRLDLIVNVFNDPKNLNLRIFTIGIGSDQNKEIPNITFQGKPVHSKLESQLLQALSEKGRGKYYEAAKFTTLDIAKDIIKEMSQDDPFLKEEKSGSPKDLIVYQLFFQIPLGIALVLFALYLYFPDSFNFFKKSPILVLALLFHMQLIASPKDDLKLAHLYFEANDFKRSEETYRKLLNQGLNNFEKAVVLYNQGTVFLFEDNLNEAIETLESISLSGHPPPFLVMRVKMNLALAQYRKALKEDNLEKAIYLLRSSDKQIKAAKKAACELSEIERRNPCKVPDELNRLASAIEEQLKEANNRLKEPLQHESTDDAFKRKTDEIYKKAMDLKPLNVKELQYLLELAAEEEHEVLLYTRFLNEQDSKEPSSWQLLEEAQKKALEIAAAYLKTSFEIQTKDYEKLNPQKKPWNEILPLYHKGYNAALEALDLIGENPEKSVLKQEEAIKYWKEALKRDVEKEEKEENKPQVEEKAENEKALQLLQDMQAGDKKQKAYPQKTLKQEVERPW